MQQVGRAALAAPAVAAVADVHEERLRRGRAERRRHVLGRQIHENRHGPALLDCRQRLRQVLGRGGHLRELEAESQRPPQHAGVAQPQVQPLQRAVVVAQRQAGVERLRRVIGIRREAEVDKPHRLLCRQRAREQKQQQQQRPSDHR